jgi:hypothetical protein
MSGGSFITRRSDVKEASSIDRLDGDILSVGVRHERVCVGRRLSQQQATIVAAEVEAAFLAEQWRIASD